MFEGGNSERSDNLQQKRSDNPQQKRSTKILPFLSVSMSAFLTILSTITLLSAKKQVNHHWHKIRQKFKTFNN